MKTHETLTMFNRFIKRILILQIVLKIRNEIIITAQLHGRPIKIIVRNFVLLSWVICCLAASENLREIAAARAPVIIIKDSRSQIIWRTNRAKAAGRLNFNLSAIAGVDFFSNINYFRTADLIQRVL